VAEWPEEGRRIRGVATAAALDLCALVDIVIMGGRRSKELRYEQEGLNCAHTL
jgi:hypothetical protein